MVIPGYGSWIGCRRTNRRLLEVFSIFTIPYDWVLDLVGGAPMKRLLLYLHCKRYEIEKLDQTYQNSLAPLVSSSTQAMPDKGSVKEKRPRIISIFETCFYLLKIVDPILALYNYNFRRYILT